MTRVEHERRCRVAFDSGWRYAPGNDDPEQRTHPDLVPWGALPHSERERNRNTVRELPSLLARGGFQVRRVEEFEDAGAKSADIRGSHSIPVQETLRHNQVSTGRGFTMSEGNPIYVFVSYARENERWLDAKSEQGLIPWLEHSLARKNIHYLLLCLVCYYVGL